jgi:Domain of unknown function (DUF4296)
MFAEILIFLQNTTNLRLKSFFKLEKLFLFAAGVSICISCQTDSYNTAELKKTAELIAELQILEAKVNRKSFASQDSATLAFKTLEKELFKKHNTDSVKFSKEFNKLALNKEKLLEVYKMAEKIVEKRVKYNQGRK